ncbi:MAG TPA: lamin tail domain-containing protein, partial [Microbacterium sp.]|nr:lamin tail domain-containing protein [Microbacterium sp.]
MHRSVRRITATAVTAALAAVGLVVPALPATAAEPTATDVFISEYIEGSSNNKAIEIANLTGAPVALGGMSLQYFNNGSVTPSLTIALSGTVAAGDVFVAAHGSAVAAILAQADLTNSAGWFNGNDAVVLRRGDVVVDSVGQVGVDPGTEWGTGLTSTMDNTLRRNSDVCTGDTNPSDAFDPAVQWQGFAVGTYDGLGAHAADCGGVDPEPVDPVINEFSANTVGTDVEYVELLGTVDADLSGYRVLEIEGDGESNIGAVDEVISFATPADGRALASLAADSLENGTMSLLLVRDFTGVLGGDVDADDDGDLDAAFPGTIVDAVAVLDGAPGDIPYGGTVLDAGDGSFGDVAPGGASRIPDGTDTDSPADWVRNDFDLAGIPGSTGTPVAGEALNTPGAANALVEVVEELCEAEAVTIGSVQGSGTASPIAGSTVDVQGVVTGDFQGADALNGYYLQDAGDSDGATSDGVFVYSPNGLDVAAGDVVHVRGAVSEFNGLTEITVVDADVCDSPATLPGPVALQLPAADGFRESLEGMRVTLPQSLAILDLFTYPRFGELSVGLGRQFQPTAVVEPGSPDRTALIAKQLEERIWLDDGRGIQNPDPLRHPNGAAFSRDNSVRSGDLVTNATGILDWRFDVWRIQPTQGADFSANPRPAVPEVGGTTKVASFNVLNYFTTLDQPNVPGDQRGANDQEEFDRQEAKIVAAL